MAKYIGFYWTLPVPWAGFRTLPTNADSAAEKSLTIRYQRDRVRQWVREERGKLTAEKVFLELQPDRGSEQVVPIVEHLLYRCQAEQAVFILVDFSEAFGWRRHGPLWDRLADERLCMPLDPAPIVLNGEKFDPVEHFRAWREIESAHASKRKAAIAKAITELQSSSPSLAALAIALNSEGVFTPSGRRWTEDNLRKFLKSM